MTSPAPRPQHEHGGRMKRQERPALSPLTLGAGAGAVQLPLREVTRPRALLPRQAARQGAGSRPSWRRSEPDHEPEICSTSTDASRALYAEGVEAHEVLAVRRSHTVSARARSQRSGVYHQVPSTQEGGMPGAEVPSPWRRPR